MKEKTIFITGAGRGLGYSLTKEFLNRGHKIYGTVRKKYPDIVNLETDFKGKFTTFKMDVRREDEINAVYEKIKPAKIDILINNAAVHLESHRPDLNDIDFSIYIPTFEINSIGPLKVTRTFLPLVKKGLTKLIVNITSEAGSIDDCWRKSEFSYCMSKTALNMASKILQNYLEKDNIKVLAIHPGWFSSDMGGEAAPITPDQAAAQVADTILKDRKPEDHIYIDPEGKKMSW
jgi:NAD(P)-dependent dehydrogenase (short-subunit alcohol dehydrogenase family)